MGRLAMAQLTVAGSTFEARVLAARLGAEGILTELRGASDGPYPLPWPVEVLVPAEELHVAREILLADQVDALFYESSPPASETE